MLIGQRARSEDLDITRLRVDLVPGSDHRVTEPVGGGRELDRHEGLASPVIKRKLDLRFADLAAAGRVADEDLAEHLFADDATKEVVDDQPLVVPAGDALC